jgi:hypothetical protein
MNLWEELSGLNEAISFPKSGWVVVNEDNKFFTKSSSNNKIWTDNVEEVAIFGTEEAAYKARQWCSDYYNGRYDFWVKKVESKNAIDKAELEAALLQVLKSWVPFVESAVEFQKLCGQDDFKEFFYSEADYKNKKKAPGLLIGILTSDDIINDVAKKLGAFVQEVVKISKREQTDPELVNKFKKFQEAWAAVGQEINKIKNIRVQVVELLKSIK